MEDRPPLSLENPGTISSWREGPKQGIMVRRTKHKMIGSIFKNLLPGQKITWGLILVFSLVAACTGNPTLDGVPPSPENPVHQTPQSTITTQPDNKDTPGAMPQESATSPELTYEQSLSTTPPAPTDLKAVLVNGKVQLSWQEPPPVTVLHYYGDEILYYKVYRRTQGKKFAFLAQVTETSYLDQDPPTGIEYFYTVTAVHPNEIESSRASEVQGP